MTDFIISNRDRHLNNVGVLRDSESLEFLVPAPIYDSGKSFFVQDIVPITDKELLNINTQSFRSNELGMLKLVRDRSLVDVGKLPSKGYIEEMYAMDSKMEDRRIKMIAEAYEKKVELFRKWQMGEKIR